jgi:hypothetical protein
VVVSSLEAYLKKLEGDPAEACVREIEQALDAPVGRRGKKNAA